MQARFFAAVASVAVGAVLVANTTLADTIRLDVDPFGTTSNLTLYGTVVTSGSATWPVRAQYRDYQFELLTSSGSTTFDSFEVALSAQLRQHTPSNNLLQASLWLGPIVANPILADALVTVSTPNSSMTYSGYSSVVLSGPNFNAAQTITTLPTTFFFRVWAAGAGENNGYQTKMAKTLDEFKAVTMTPNQSIDGLIEFDANDDGLISPIEESSADPIAEVLVPEIDPSAAGCVLAFVAGMLGLLEGRRLKAA